MAIRPSVFPTEVAVFHAVEAERKTKRFLAALKGTGGAELPGSSPSAKTALEQAIDFDEAAAGRDHDYDPASPTAEREPFRSAELLPDL